MNPSRSPQASSSATERVPPFFVGIDLGGTSIKVGVVDDTGRVLAADSVPTEAAEGPEAGIRRMCEAARKVATDGGLSWDEVAAIGVGSPGTMDIPAGMVLEPHNLTGWHNVPLRQRVAEELRKLTILQNDANAAAYGEYWVGAGRDAQSMVLFTLGTGIGCGIIVDGMIIEGRHSHGAECGHLIIQMTGGRQCGCGRYGCLEAYASATALIKRARETAEGVALWHTRGKRLQEAVEAGREPTPLLLAELAAAGDELAEELILETARYLAIGAVNLMHTIDPDLIVLGGAMTFGRDEEPLGRRFREEIEAEVHRRAFPVPAAKTRIVYATLGSDAGFIGAAGCGRLAQRGNKS
ncbi:MAG: ROK family protein [Planctomycetes bacterium]|nr:ROK family protein [Planctomycetota bacterium]